MPPAKRTPKAVRGEQIARPKARTVGREDRTGSAPRPADTPTGLGALEKLAADGFDMADLLGGASSPAPLPEAGTRVHGTLLRRSGAEWAVDLGASVEGWIAAREIEDGVEGQPVEAFVIEANETHIQLSIRLTGPAAAAFLDEAAEAGVPVEAKVVARTGPGFDVRIGPARAFLPISQAARLPMANPDALIGETLDVLVIEHGEKTVVSRRALEEQDIEAARAARLAHLAEGDVVRATVTSVQPWGAFLDVDGVDLRLSKRDFDWDEPEDLTTRLERGAVLDVRVQQMRDDGRIDVSTRDPSLDPWNDVARTLPIGEVVSGKVVSVTEFGVFVRITTGIDGLIHRSRLGRIPEEGHEIEVRIVSVDADRRRVELSPGDAPPPEPDETAEVRSALASQDHGSMGTLGDLLRAKLGR